MLNPDRGFIIGLHTTQPRHTPTLHQVEDVPWLYLYVVIEVTWWTACA